MNFKETMEALLAGKAVRTTGMRVIFKLNDRGELVDKQGQPIIMLPSNLTYEIHEEKPVEKSSDLWQVAIAYGEQYFVQTNLYTEEMISTTERQGKKVVRLSGPLKIV